MMCIYKGKCLKFDFLRNGKVEIIMIFKEFGRKRKKAGKLKAIYL